MRNLILALKGGVPAKLAGLLVSCAVLGGCVYPDIDLQRYDLTAGDGGLTLRFSFVVEGEPSPNTEAAGTAMASSRSVLPGSFTAPAVYKVSVRPAGAGQETAQTAYIPPNTGEAGGGGYTLTCHYRADR